MTLSPDLAALVVTTPASFDPGPVLQRAVDAAQAHIAAGDAAAARRVLARALLRCERVARAVEEAR